MVWKIASEYRKLAKPRTHNTFVSAALGSKQADKHHEEKFEIPQLKFPSEHEEEESIKLFHRCGGPLAASYAGRMKLVQDEKHFYGDGRPLSFCRVSGCQMVHSESQMVSYILLLFFTSCSNHILFSLMAIPTPQRYLCNWHHAMIYKAGGTVGLKRPLMKDTTPPSLPSAVKRAKVAQSHPATQTAAGGSNAYPISASGYTWAFPSGYPHHYPNTMLPSAYAAYASATMKSSVPPHMMRGTRPVSTKLPPATKPPPPSNPDEKLSTPSKASMVTNNIMPHPVDPATKPPPPSEPDVKLPPTANRGDLAGTAMAVETPLEPADNDISNFMGC